MEKDSLAEMFLQMNVDLEQTTKTLTYLLRQNPKSVKDFTFKAFCQRSIVRLYQAAKLPQPQDASNATPKENKDPKPPLITMVTSFLEIN